MNNQSIVAISYTKLRTAFGMVGIEVDSEKKIAYVRLTKLWKRENMNSIPQTLKDINSKVQWDMTFADQLVGQHLIRAMEHSLGFEVQTITTQKNLKDPENIELIKVMDMTEMTQLTLSLKQDHKIQFPPKPTEDMEELMKQTAMFTEHSSEQGTIAYYAPGDELDCLIKALMICLFAGRIQLQHGDNTPIIRRGTPQQQTAEDSFEEFFDSAMGGSDSSDLSVAHLNRTNKFKIFERTRKRYDF